VGLGNHKLEDQNGLHLNQAARACQQKRTCIKRGRSPESRGSQQPSTPLGTDRSILETISTGQPKEDTVAWRLFDALHERRLSPDALFAAGLRFVQFADTSQFKRQLAVHMRRWVHDCWTYVIEQQTFLLRNPRLTVPAIKVAINSADEGLGYVGKILLSVEPAISSKLDPSFRTYLGALDA
jgi:hypothetical protein